MTTICCFEGNVTKFIVKQKCDFGGNLKSLLETAKTNFKKLIGSVRYEFSP